MGAHFRIQRLDVHLDVADLDDEQAFVGQMIRRLGQHASHQVQAVIATGQAQLRLVLVFVRHVGKVFGIDISPFPQETPSSTFAFHQADLTAPNAADEAVAACIRKFGPRIDVLANVAGVMDAFSSADTVKESEWERVLNINLTVPVRLMAAVLPSMKEHGGGAIVNVSSAASRTGASGEYVDYAASKGAMDTLTKGLSLEVASQGIRVNSVRPGLIYTDMHADGGEPGRVDRLASALPMGRGGQAEEIAAAIVWLASDAASYVTGTFIDAAGGR